MRGGCFPEVVQAYLWCLCEERGINYYVVVALIERKVGINGMPLEITETVKDICRFMKTGIRRGWRQRE